VDIVAPGDQIVAAAPGGGHATFRGTSFATPFVSATAALIRARWPALNRAEVERRLLATADPAAGARPSPDYGFGVLNPMRALTETMPPPVPADAPVARSDTVGYQPATPTDQPARSRAVAVAVAVAGILILLAAAVAAFAAAIPFGRRRGWRPGRGNEP
jgi:membrane-anchored mycosin MYCP